jgi:hypothetical protein
MGRVMREALNVQDGFLVDGHGFLSDITPGMVGGIFGGF